MTAKQCWFVVLSSANHRNYSKIQLVGCCCGSLVIILLNFNNISLVVKVTVGWPGSWIQTVESLVHYEYYFSSYSVLLEFVLDFYLNFWKNCYLFQRKMFYAETSFSISRVKKMSHVWKIGWYLRDPKGKALIICFSKIKTYISTCNSLLFFH